MLFEALEIKKEIRMGEVQQILDKAHVYPVVKKLIDKEVCFIRENLKEKYKPGYLHFLNRRWKHRHFFQPCRALPFPIPVQ